MTIPSPPEDSDPPAPGTADVSEVSGFKAHMFRALGAVLLALGFVGLILPVLPTTVFFIGAAACFARSSPRLHAYLMQHPQAGPALRDWFDEGAIGSNSKAAALFGMGLAMAIVVVTVSNPAIMWVGGIILVASAWFVVSRPVPSREEPPSGQPPP